MVVGIMIVYFEFKLLVGMLVVCVMLNVVVLVGVGVIVLVKGCFVIL